MQTGTVSGEIRLALTMRAGGTDITPSPAPTLTGRIAKSRPGHPRRHRPPRHRRPRSGGDRLLHHPRHSSATFRFSPASGSSLQTTELTVQLTEGARGWYQSEASRPFGSQFTLTQLFTVQGDTSAIASVSVTLANTAGTSPAGSASF